MRRRTRLRHERPVLPPQSSVHQNSHLQGQLSAALERLKCCHARNHIVRRRIIRSEMRFQSCVILLVVSGPMFIWWAERFKLATGLSSWKGRISVHIDRTEEGFDLGLQEKRSWI